MIRSKPASIASTNGSNVRAVAVGPVDDRAHPVLLVAYQSRHGRTVVTHRDEPDVVPEAVFDRIAAVPIAGGEVVPWPMRGDGQTPGPGRTSLVVRPVASHGLTRVRLGGPEAGG